MICCVDISTFCVFLFFFWKLLKNLFPYFFSSCSSVLAHMDFFLFLNVTPSFYNPVYVSYQNWVIGYYSKPILFSASMFTTNISNSLVSWLLFIFCLFLYHNQCFLSFYSLQFLLHTLPSNPHPCIIHSSSNVSFLIQLGLSWISPSHGLSCCSVTRHILFYFKAGWGNSVGRMGPKKQATESETSF